MGKGLSSMGRKRRAHMTATFVMSTSIVGKILSAERERKSAAKAICLQKFV